ncbi:MAG: EamA family transporter [Clostridia bacterium]|nr:EamA family transporter [Clostridia bacterium]MBQ6938095.1 EamA family transporter [Clostridia bacterium]
MENLWIIFIFIYSFLKGSREGMKKAALKKSSSSEILFFYTLIGFILTIPFSKDAFSLAPIYIFYVFLKSAVVCTAWIFAFIAIDKMSVSLYGITDLSRMVFSTLLGVIVLGESFTVQKAIGVILVIAGLMLANLKKTSSGTKEITLPVLIAVLLNCFLNAVSGTMDKVLMKYMLSSQLQFWFMLFTTVIYGAILLVKREKISIKTLKTNYWVPLMSISLIIGDRLLFEANASPLSEVTVMTVIKQSSVIVTVLTGWLVFKEKHILYKMMCTLIVLSGIFIALI